MGRFKFKIDCGRAGVGKYYEDVFLSIMTNEGEIVKEMLDYCQRFRIDSIVTTETIKGEFKFRLNFKLNTDGLGLSDWVDLFIFTEGLYRGEKQAASAEIETPENPEIPLPPG